MYHLYQQTQMGRVAIIATRPNRHTLRDVMKTKAKYSARGPGGSVTFFIRDCQNAGCQLCAKQSAAVGRAEAIAKPPRRPQRRAKMVQRYRAIQSMRRAGCSWRKLGHLYGLKPQSLEVAQIRMRNDPRYKKAITAP